MWLYLSFRLAWINMPLGSLRVVKSCDKLELVVFKAILWVSKEK